MSSQLDHLGLGKGSLLGSSLWGWAEKGSTVQTARFCTAAAVVLCILVRLESRVFYSFSGRVHPTNTNQHLLHFRHGVSALITFIYSGLNVYGGQ